MSVRFAETSKTGIGFAVGTSYTSAIGQKISEPEGKKIDIPFPKSMFVTLFNTGTQGSFSISYSYQDREPGEAETLFSSDYTIEDTKSKFSELFANVSLLQLLIRKLI